MDTKKEEEKNKNTNSNEGKNNENSINKDLNQQNPPIEVIIDLGKLVGKSEIQNSDLILAIFEICTFNKKYNYDCSNNTKAFWERVVDEEILKKIFKNFKSETLRKYWKIIRMAGNNNKFIDTVKHNEKFINNPVFKLLPIINAISSFVQSNEKNFEEFFIDYNSKDKKIKEVKEDNENNNINFIGNKRHQEKSISPPPKIAVKINQENNNVIKNEEKTEEKNPKMEQLDELVNKLMEISKFSREEVVRALYGTSNNLENAYKYLQDNEKYDKYFFVQTDDYIIKNLRNKGYYIDLINQKGEELVKEREKFLGIK
jgi:hypothetical protein